MLSLRASEADGRAGMASGKRAARAAPSRPLTMPMSLGRPMERGGPADTGIARARQSCAAIELPENAYLTGSAYGDGWKCGRGYEKEESALRFRQRSRRTASSRTSSRGRAWECNRGYRPEGDSCVAIKIPTNGYLADTRYGKGWACDRGYREAGDRLPQDDPA